MNAAKAAIAAGYAPGTSTTHLEQDREIMNRIEELFEEQKAQREAQRAAAIEAAKVVGQMTGVSRAFVIQKLAENAQNAAADGQFKESNAALELIGKDLGMFNGGADNDSGGPSIPHTLDLDKLDALTGGALDALPPPEKSEADLAREFSPDVALDLIAGQVKPQNKPDMAKARRLSTGSETDVALGADIPEVDAPPADLPSDEDILALEPIDPSEFG